jgi:intracellular multiplication protein IcmJ
MQSPAHERRSEEPPGIPAASVLTLSCKSRIWDAGNASEDRQEAIDPALRREIAARDGYRCLYCGVRSEDNEIHHLNDNHRDSAKDNLRTADPLCHAWQHLGEGETADAVIAYLPGISGGDVNLLQRTIMAARQSDDPALRKEAEELHAWLVSRRRHAENVWGSVHPADFAEAVVRQPAPERSVREELFNGLAVIFALDAFSVRVRQQVRESYAAFPVANWRKVYRDVVNPPA